MELASSFSEEVHTMSCEIDGNAYFPLEVDPVTHKEKIIGTQPGPEDRVVYLNASLEEEHAVGTKRVARLVDSKNQERIFREETAWSDGGGVKWG